MATKIDHDDFHVIVSQVIAARVEDVVNVIATVCTESEDVVATADHNDIADGNDNMLCVCTALYDSTNICTPHFDSVVVDDDDISLANTFFYSSD